MQAKLKRASEATYIHIGVGKTGTTTLQNHVFPTISSCHLISPISRQKIEGCTDDLLYTLIDRERFEYQFQESSMMAWAEQIDRPLIISDEAFATGSPASGKVCRGEIAKRLRALFPGAKILFVIRSQMSIFPSVYLQIIKHSKRTFRQKDFAVWLDAQINGCDRASWATWLDYFVTYQIYSELFGASKVFIATYEDLMQDTGKFAETVSGFLDRRASASDIAQIMWAGTSNKRASRGYLHLSFLRRLWIGNVLSEITPKKTQNWATKCVSRIGDIYPQISESQCEQIQQIFGSSNAALQQESGLDLVRRGYPQLSGID